MIYKNPYKDIGNVISGRIEEYLRTKGIGCSMFDPSGSYDEETVILVLGGDGTMLRAVREMDFAPGLVIGINLGTLGFLSEIETENLENSLDKLIDGNFTIEKRMLLEGCVEDHNGKKDDNILALNDIVLTRAGGLMVLKYGTYVNNQALHDYLADGMIVATPTGSTGYNLSAMGPIASPASEMIILTPVCPHSLGQRSVILSSDDEVCITISESKDGKQQEALVSFDGAITRPVTTGDRIVIRKSDKYVNIARLGKDSFLDILGKKMAE